MEKEIFTLEETIAKLRLVEGNHKVDDEVLKWIIIKSLRLTRDQYESIKKVEFEKIEQMENALKRYITGESLSQIFGYIEFCGNIFDVTENVFDPRLSTEALVYETVNSPVAKRKNLKIIDLCTGSGCIAISISKLLNIDVDAVDISPYALEIAQKNCDRLGGKVRFFVFDLNQDWNEGLKGKKYDVIVSNPPYWASEKIFDNEEITRNNPLIAFDGGDDGLKYLKIIIKNAKNFLNSNGMLFLEIDPEQADKIAKILIEDGFSEIKIAKDHRNINRVISAKKHK